MKLKRAIVLALFPILAGCNSEDAWDGIKTAGEVITQEWPVDDFHTIWLLDWVDLEITQDTACWLIITGPKNIIADVTAEVVNDTLHIRDNNKHKWVRGFDHRVTMRMGVRHLKWIYLEGPASISTTNTLNSEYFTFRTQNSSGNISLKLNAKRFRTYMNRSHIDMRAEGTAEHAHINLRGNGFVRFDGLKVKGCTANNYGGGDISLYVTESLSGLINGPGNILYRGNPTHTSFSIGNRGTGRFINLDAE